jgi:hypothetical protein
MKAKNIYKIGISLLVALFMLLPAGVMAMNSVPKAGDYRNTTLDTTEFRMPRDLNSQVPPEVLPAGVRLNGELIDGDVIPLADSFTIEGGTIVSDPCPLQDMFPQIQAGISIYEITDGIEVIMYETSFEDNFDIYNNWIQIDEDCGIVGGQYDSWSWSDARASDGDHSMKSTMYDIYKGNQDDYLQMRNCIDMSGQDRVKIEFDVWVEGQDNQDNTFVPTEFYDYVSFEVYDAGTWWTVFPIHFSDTTLPLYAPRWGWDLTSYVEELGDGWWHVTFDVPNSWFIDDTCVAIRFDWHSDPQFQYEGGYVDNVKLISVEGEREKIWQTHLQQCEEIDCHIDWTMFPLEWTPPGPGNYEIVYWVETENCPTAHLYDSTFPKPGIVIPFELGDNYDCEITDLFIEDSFTHAIVPPDGQMNEGADAHIVFEYHQGGNLVGENIPVELSVYKKTWETLLDIDMESNMAINAADSGGEYERTEFDPWDGKHLAFWDGDTKQIVDGTFSYVLFAQTIDFESAEEVLLNYYAKWELPAGAYARPYLYDPQNFYLLAAGYVVNVEPENQMQGSQPFWIGPMQPAGRYTDFSLKGCYEWYKAAGFFRDYSGELVDKVGFGFYLVDPADGVVFNDHEGTWSGLFIDDVTVTSLMIGEEVFSDTMIIPGPVEPCEYVTAQFEWEDVPFSRYRICVETVCEDDIDSDNNEMCQQIIVADPLERIDKPESTDNTGDCDGGWGICGSDIDYYLSSNPDDEYYQVDSVYAAYFDGCIDFCDLGLDIDDNYYVFIDEDFSGGVPPAGWTEQDAGEWVSYNGNLAGGTAPEADLYQGNIVGSGSWMRSPVFDASSMDSLMLEFKSRINWNSGAYNCRVEVFDGAIWNDITPWANPITGDLAAATYYLDITSYIASNMQVRFRLNGYAPTEHQWWVIDDILIDGTDVHDDPVLVEFDFWCDLEDGWDYVYLEIADECPPDQEIDWIFVEEFGFATEYGSGFVLDGSYLVSLTPIGDDWYHGVWDIATLLSDCDFTLRFVMDSDVSWTERGFLVDNFLATGMDEVDTMDNMDNWISDCVAMGDYWDTSALPYCLNIPYVAIDDSLIWATEIMDAYEAWMTIDVDYLLPGIWCFGPPFDLQMYKAEIEISADGGSTWYLLDTFEGTGTETLNFDVTPWAGNEILIKFTVYWDGVPGNAPFASFCDPVGYFCIDDAWIA